jgi:hypothetical protein
MHVRAKELRDSGEERIDSSLPAMVIRGNMEYYELSPCPLIPKPPKKSGMFFLNNEKIVSASSEYVH